MIICKECKEEGIHEGKGLCLNCYKKLRYRNKISKTGKFKQLSPIKEKRRKTTSRRISRWVKNHLLRRVRNANRINYTNISKGY